MFLHSTFFFLFYWLVDLALKVAGKVVHPSNLVLGREYVTQASAGGCRANPVR